MELTEKDFEVVDKVCENFNYERVLKAMKALDWRYADLKQRTISPELSDLIRTSRYVTKEAIRLAKKSGYSKVQRGGFICTATVEEGSIYCELLFSIEESDNYE